MIVHMQIGPTATLKTLRLNNTNKTNHLIGGERGIRILDTL